MSSGPPWNVLSTSKFPSKAIFVHFCLLDDRNLMLSGVNFFNVFLVGILFITVFLAVCFLDLYSSLFKPRHLLCGERRADPLINIRWNKSQLSPLVPACVCRERRRGGGVTQKTTSCTEKKGFHSLKRVKCISVVAACAHRADFSR